MITILHGENTLASRKVLVNKIVSYKLIEATEVARIDGAKTNFTDILQAAESPSLFGQKRLVIVENFFTNQNIKFKQKVLDYFLGNKNLSEIIFWERRQLSSTIRRKWDKVAHFVEFKIPGNIFKFLDSVRPKNTKTMLLLLHDSIVNEDTEMIFYMLVRQFRFLLLAKEGSSNLVKMPSWQSQRFLKQAESFSFNDLKKIYDKLLEIDIGQKTGKSIVPLVTELDLLIANL